MTLRVSFDPVPNNASWVEDLKFIDHETELPWFDENDPPDEITLHVRDRVSGTVYLSGSLSGGELTVTGDGMVRVSFINLSALCGAKTYEVMGLYTETTGGEVRDYVIGFLPVLEGF